MTLRAASAPDPFVLVDPPGHGAIFQDVRGKIISTPRLTPDESTGIFVIAGQSNGVNIIPDRYTPTNATKVDQISIYDGGTYRAVDPLIGCEAAQGNVFSRMADKLVTAGVFQRVILVPTNVGGTSVAEWAPGGVCNSRLVVAKRRLMSLGLSPTGWIWMQGETDGALGTTQSNYLARLGTVIGTPRALGDTAPWLIGRCTYQSGVTVPAVQAAQVAAVNGTDIFAGADTDTLTGTALYRNPADDTHLTTAGADAASTLWANAVNAVF